MKKLYRSRTDRRIAGVCGGIAEYFGIDTTIVRILFGIVLGFFVLKTFGSAVLLYIVLAIIIPIEPYQQNTHYFFGDDYRKKPKNERKDVTPK